MLRLGIAGVGRVGQIAHLAHYAALPDLDITIADLRPDLANEVAQRYGVRAVVDHHALLAQGLDALVVVVRREALGPIVLDALAAGVPVLSEKPVAMTLTDAERLRDAAIRHGVLYAAGYMKRSDAGVAHARDLLQRRRQDGAWGALVRVEVWSEAGIDGAQPQTVAMTAEARPSGLETWEAAPDWLPPSLRGAYEETLNVHSHATNLVRWMLDAPLAITTAQRDGALVTVTAQAADIPVAFALRDDRRSSAWSEGASFVFAGGTLRLDLPAPFLPAAAARVTESSPAGTQVHTVDADGGAFARQCKSFVAAVRGTAKFPALGADAVHDVAFADDLWRRLTAPAFLETR
ncbi:Gfo/Idh/MocA family protein [Roseiterribacter gracilis]|uniref:Gfo/Idh/MocA family protein n=1 Tax=Roseiterribacter gracilis TaxID=2812848 RepID=UPI003B42AC95